MTRASPDLPGSPPWRIAAAGAVALAVAMGIGRFAFTPLLPMMLADGVVDLHAASWLASANYLGYLFGALFCALRPWKWMRGRRPASVGAGSIVRIGLVATGVLTLAMALPWSAAWPTLRFLAGAVSAVVFVYSSGWCLAHLARLGVPAVGGLMYTGPGAGIIASGLLASVMMGFGWRASTGWLFFGILAFALCVTVWRLFDDGVPLSAPPPPAPIGAPRAAARRRDSVEVACLAVAYGLAGLGYIISATFLPVIARQAMPDSPWLDLFWPLFGVGIVVGALLATRLHVAHDLRRPLAVAYVIQALGIGISLWSPTLAGFAFGSLLLGLPFTAITFFAMQEVRILNPAAAASRMAYLTAMYGIGQIAGPWIVAVLLRRQGSARDGFNHSMEIACAALILGAILYVAMQRLFPRTATK
jgi:MFS family permease